MEEFAAEVRLECVSLLGSQLAPEDIIADGECDKLTLYGREHAYLIPHGARLPFIPTGKAFRLRRGS